MGFFFHKTKTNSFLPYRYDVIHSDLHMHEELISLQHPEQLKYTKQHLETRVMK